MRGHFTNCGCCAPIVVTPLTARDDGVFERDSGSDVSEPKRCCARGLELLGQEFCSGLRFVCSDLWQPSPCAGGVSSESGESRVRELKRAGGFRRTRVSTGPVETFYELALSVSSDRAAI